MARRGQRAARCMMRLGGAAVLVVGVSAIGLHLAAAHSCAEPVTIAKGSETDVEVGITVGDVPTDLVGFEFPTGFEISGADGARGWDAAVDGNIVQFSGGQLEAGSCALFAVSVKAPKVGEFRVRAVQKVGDGQYVEHPPDGDVFVDTDGNSVVVDHNGPPNPAFEQVIIVTEGDEASSPRVALLLVTAGAVVIGAAAFLLLRRRKSRATDSA